MNSARILIFANGVLPDLERARRLVQPGDTVFCADGGTRHALDLGLTPAVIIGDLDSLESSDREQLAPAAGSLRTYSRDKDETDLELALQQALEQKPAAILVVGALGNRLDQTLGNLSILSHPNLSGVDCRLDDGVEEAFFCRNRASVHGVAGDLVSLVPWGVEVGGVRTDGLRWPLRREPLYPDRTRGISNEMLGQTAAVQIESGLLLIIHRRRT